MRGRGLRPFSLRLSRQRTEMSNSPSEPTGYAVISGGASGIGMEFARLLHGDGWRIAIVDIDDEAAERAASLLPDALPCPMDVSHERHWAQLRMHRKDQWPRLDLLVNSAGILLVGECVDNSTEDLQRVVSVNLLGTMLGCQAMLPWLQKSSDSSNAPMRGIVNVSSIFGDVPPPYFSAYAASKAGVIAFSESLRGELARRGLNITVAVPGIVKTGLFERGHYSSDQLGDRVATFAADASITPAEVATESLRAFERKKLYAVIGNRARRYRFLKRLLPARIIDIVAKRVRKALGPS